MIHTVQRQDVLPQPWRNGGGSTCELLAWPPGADWQCRISVARIESHGPFSSYAGVERWIAVVQGEGMVLHFANRRVRLSMGSAPLRFDGASAPQCGLLGGATQDLNLMAQNAAGHADMFTVQTQEDWASSAALRAVYTATAATLQVDDGPGLNLPAHTLAYSEQASLQRWRLTPAPTAATGQPVAHGAWWLQFTARPS